MAPQEQPLRVLLVEDSPADARLIQEELKEVPSARIEVLHVMRLAEAERVVREAAALYRQRIVPPGRDDVQAP